MRKYLDVVLTTLAGAFCVGILTGCSPAAKKARALEQAARDFDAGSYGKAEIEYLNVLQEDPKEYTAIVRLGKIYADQGRLPRALPFLLKARDLQPNDVALRIQLGRTLLAGGKTKEARDDASFVFDHWPDNPEAPLFLAEVALTSKGIEESRQRLLASPPALLNSAAV